MPPSPNADPPPLLTTTAFLRGMWAGATSLFALVLIGTYIGLGALAHDLGFSLAWTLVATVLLWAGPAQVILTSALGSGAALVEVGVAVGLSSVRLLPMVVALLPMIRSTETRTPQLLLPAHFIAVSLWMESLRLLPGVARENRVAFVDGMGVGMAILAMLAATAGYYLAGGLPLVLSAALLFLTPLSFMMSLARNARVLSDRLAVVLGLAIAPLAAAYQVPLDLMWSGIAAGTLGYGVARLRGRSA